MTNEFNVIGQRKDDDLHLLVRGDDGKHYDYAIASEDLSPVDPDENWVIDSPSTDTPEGGEDIEPLEDASGDTSVE